MKKVLIIGVVILVAASSFTIKQPPDLKASVSRGAKVYKATCIACHQADGLGVQRMNPPIVKTKWVLGDKKALAKIVINGLKGGEIEIDGDEFHNPMPLEGVPYRCVFQHALLIEFAGETPGRGEIDEHSPALLQFGLQAFGREQLPVTSNLRICGSNLGGLKFVANEISTAREHEQEH